MCLKYFFDKPKGLQPPQGLIDINMDEIQQVLTKEVPHAAIYLSDSTYRTISIHELMRFLKDDKTNEYRYVSEYMDCDDYSYHLMGSIHNVEWGALPFGITWTSTPNGAHACNCFIDNDHILWFIEPQKDNIFRLPMGWVPYLVII